MQIATQQQSRLTVSWQVVIPMLLSPICAPVIIVFRLGVVVAGGQFLFPICAPKTDGFLDGGGHGPAGGGAGPRG